MDRFSKNFIMEKANKCGIDYTTLLHLAKANKFTDLDSIITFHKEWEKTRTQVKEILEK